MKRSLCYFILLSSALHVSAASPMQSHSRHSQFGKIVLPQFHQAPECTGRPDFLTESRTEIVATIDNLPQMGLLIARSVEYYVEATSPDRASSFRVHGYQSFLKGDAKIICGTNLKSVEERFSLFAPTLIDATRQHKIGNSVWQFQLFANGDVYSMWNIKSPISDGSGKLDKLLRKVGSSYKLYQIGYNEYELLITQENKDFVQQLSVRYDAAANVKSDK